MLGTPSLPRNTTRVSTWCWQVVLLATGYYAFAQIGLLVPSHFSSISFFWPAIGLAVAVLYRNGRSLWPGVFLGAFATNYSLSGPLASLGIGIGSTSEAVLTVYLLRRFKLNPTFESLRDVRIHLASTAIGSLLSAVVSTTWCTMTGAIATAQLPQAAISWWFGDLAGIFLVVPVILSWNSRLIPRYRRRGIHRELAVTTVSTIAISVVLFSGLVPNGTWSLPLTFLPILCVAWAAASGRTWPAMVQVLILSLFTIHAHAKTLGPCEYLDGSVRPFAMWAYILTMGVVALGLSALLSERDEVERQLKASEETYRAIVHDNPALICQFKTDGSLMIVNQTFRRSFQEAVKSEERWATRTDLRSGLKPQNFYELTGLAKEPHKVRALRNLAEPDKPTVFDSSVQSPTGEMRWYRWTARAVDMSSSIITEYHAVGLEITKEKRAEAERKTLEAQAIQTQQYEAIGVLAGGIAHEFNNILTSVLGFTDLLCMMFDENHRARPMLEEVRSGAQRAADLTRQLMIYGGQSHTYPKPLHISHLIDSSVKLLAVAVPKTCRLKYELMTDEPMAIADESKIRQLLMSLVTNSAESLASCAAGEIRVKTSLVPLDGDSAQRQWVNGSVLTTGEYIQLEVTDTGSGMDAVTLERIFEPFFTTKFPGRGLGMAAVLGIVQDHLGAIQVESRPTIGTRVRVILPVASLGREVCEPTPIPVGSRRSAILTQQMLARLS